MNKYVERKGKKEKKARIENKERKKNGRRKKKRKKESSTELQKPNVEAEVYVTEEKKAQKLNWIS